MSAGAAIRRATAPAGRIVTAVEFRHPDAPGAVRLVNDTADLAFDGETWTRARFDARLASDGDRKPARARITADNVGRALSAWLETAAGGAGGTARVLQIAIDDDDRAAAEADWDLMLDIARVIVAADTVTVELGFEPLLRRPAVAVRADPETAPGLF